jgi:hypothetical protein
LSVPVKVDLLALLKPYDIVPGSLVEWTLSHNQLKKTQLDKKIIWNTSSAESESSEESSVVDKDSMIVTIKPMQIKTFTLKCASI